MITLPLACLGVASDQGNRIGSVISGFTQQRVQDLENQSIIELAGESIDVERVDAVIRAAIQQSKWDANTLKAGSIVATLNSRNHQAVVSILYDSKAYSITYSDSTNLRYDGENIHRNYNKWVNALDIKIRQGLRKTRIDEQYAVAEKEDGAGSGIKKIQPIEPVTKKSQGLDVIPEPDIGERQTISQRLKRLKAIRDEDLISDEEYNSKRKVILEEL